MDQGTINLMLEDALLTKVESVLGTNNQGKNTYLSFMRPGMTFRKEDLEFCTKGTNGVDADDTQRLISTAANFAAIVNNIPSDRSGAYTPSGRRIEDVYLDILRYSKVPKDSLTEAEKANIERLRSLLVQKKTTQDIITLEEKVEYVETPLTQAYIEAQADYLEAQEEFNEMRTDAINAVSKEAVQKFAANGAIYRKKLQTLARIWETRGHKSDYEKISSYIKMMSQRSMAVLKEELQDKMMMSKVYDVIGFREYYPTLLTSAAFLDDEPSVSENAWTDVSFDSSDYERHEKWATSQTSAGVSFRWGFLRRVQASGGYSKSEHHLNLDVQGLQVSFKITQAQIDRPWFSMNFVTNNSWDWANGEKRVISGGDDDENGEMHAMPVTAIFVKDIEFKSSKLKEQLSEVKKSMNAGVSVNIGPFRLGASHARTSNQEDVTINEAEGSIKVSSMQLFGFWCVKMPKTPNCTVEGALE